MVFETVEDKMVSYIDDHIFCRFPEDEREDSRSRVEKIVQNWEGREIDALSVLTYAFEGGRFGEFARKLEEHYKKSLQYVHPEARRMKTIPGANRAERFILDCYKELDVNLTEQK